MNPYIEVSLTWSQVLLAANLGSLRQIEAIFSDMKDAPGVDPDNGWSLHIEGVAGEIAFAIATNTFFPFSINAGKDPDVGRVQVRTRSEHNNELPFRPKDDPKWPYVFVTGKIPNFRVWGWMYGYEIVKPEWKKDLGNRSAPAYYAPRAALRPLSELPPEALLGDTIAP